MFCSERGQWSEEKNRRYVFLERDTERRIVKRKEEGEGRQVATRRAYRTYERRLHSSKHQEVVHILRERENMGARSLS